MSTAGPADETTSTTRIRCPFSSARSCSRPSACSSGDWGQRREAQERGPPVRVEADVAPGESLRNGLLRRRHRVGRRLPHVGDRRAREPECLAVRSGDDLDDVRREKLEWIINKHCGGRDVRMRRGPQRFDRGVDGRRVEERFVALEVDDDVRVGHRRGGLGHPV